MTKVRGLRDVALFKTFQIGFANGSLLEILPKDADAVAQLKALGVLPPMGRVFSRLVVFPLWSADGVIVNLYGRRIVDGEVNHPYLPGEQQGLGTTKRANARRLSC